MGQPRIIERKISLAATGDPSGNDVLRCWDAPDSESFKNFRIVISSRGTVLPANNLDWEVFYGGGWTGKPFDSSSTHTGGLSQGSGSVGASAEIANVIYEDVSTLPSNKDVGPSFKRNYGFPIVLELTNNKAAEVTVYVTFISETIGTNV